MTPPARSSRTTAIVAALVLAAVGCGTGDASTGDEDAATATTATTAAVTADPAADDPGPTDPSSTDPDSATPTAPTPTEPAPIDLRSTDRVVEHRIELVASHPHDTASSTQGLEVVGDLLLETTGGRGRSVIRLVEPETGEVRVEAALDDELYGEGATVVGDEVWQLTWTSGVAILRGLDDLAERRRVAYAGEGWGLCHDGERLVMSDGSATLTFRDPGTFEILGTVAVVDDDGEAVPAINELECVGGVVWANLYQTTRLVAIDPGSGRVVGRADVAELVPPGFEGQQTDVPNGIAADPATGRFWLTGKRWPVLHEVELIQE